jgi:hypothetical protein
MSGFEGVRAAVLGAVVVGILLIAVGTQGGGAAVMAEATAAAQTAVARQYEYFPANFPAPQGPVEPHIEAF